MNHTEAVLEKSFARRAEHMVGREDEWARIRAALAPGGPLRVVLLRGPGGLGKSRLLEEIQRQFGRGSTSVGEDDHFEPAQLPHVGDVVIGNIVDVIDTHLHDRFQFIVALRNSLKPYRSVVRFDKFDTQLGVVQNLQAGGTLYEGLIEEQDKLADAFVEDLRANARNRRIVFLVDTVERLSYAGPEWLFTKNILKPADLEIRTHYWLQTLVAQNDLDNVTLILAGRDQTDENDSLEGRYFFGAMRDAVSAGQEAGYLCESEDIKVKPLSAEETRRFLEQYAADWRARGDSTMAHAYEMAADPHSDRYKVIHLYTDGIPVLVALYAQIIAEGKQIPPAFNFSIKEARQIAGLPPDLEGRANHLPEPTPELLKLRWDIEQQFVEILFRNPQSMRQDMILSLLRAPRGLTAEQLHFLLNTTADKDTWVEYLVHSADDRKDILQKYLQELQQIAVDYWGKGRADSREMILDDGADPKPTTFRIGLQDELYRIYAEHMGLFAEPTSRKTQPIRDMLRADENRYETNRNWEAEERHLLYKKLEFFADHHYQKSLKRKREYLAGDEARFEDHFVLDEPNSYDFPALSWAQTRQRLALHTAQTFFEIERMIYSLLQEPESSINYGYITLEDDNDKAARHEEDFWAQAEMWRALFDDWLMKFAHWLPPRPAAVARGESSVTVLRRVAEQESVARWIKRFVLRGSATRALEFSRDAEAVIRDFPRGDDETPTGKEQRNVWRSWNHTLAREERAIWTQVGVIRRGVDAKEAAEKIRHSIGNLEKLYLTPVTLPAATESEYEENGFAPTPDQPAHPAYMRLRRLLSHAHNHLGYSQRTLGHMRRAVEHYATSLEYVRTERNIMQAHRGKVLNNLSRALSELGWNSLGVCLDGLDLRWETAEEVPLASSYNTLALIYDDMGRYEDAPLLSAKAIAYCRRATENRQLALALRQMAESLRHVAGRAYTGQRAGSPDNFFDAAERLLNDARAIFSDLSEVERQVEIDLEFGSLFRDRMAITPDRQDEGLDKHSLRFYYQEALNLLDRAERSAREYGFQQHVLDAQLNQARVHFLFGNVPASEEILNTILVNEEYANYKIDKQYWPNSHELRDRNWAFRHLSTAQRVLGWIAFDRFEERVKVFKAEYPDDTPEERAIRVAADSAPKGARHPEVYAQNALQAAANAYALAYAYAWLYSPRSRTFGSLEKELYRRVRKFNRSELDALNSHLAQVRFDFPVLTESILPVLSRFFDEFFGPGLEGTHGDL